MVISTVQSRKRAIALTIAGFDPSSGAGVTADLQTFAAHGVFGCACPTAITVQSTQGVGRVQALDGCLVRDVLEALDGDLLIEGIKIGMLATAEIVEAVCEYIERISDRKVLVVLDPVLRASSGAELIDEEGFQLLHERLMPLVDVVTPNHDELFALLGREESASDLGDASLRFLARYPGLHLVVTGGDERSPDDLVVGAGSEPVWLRGDRVESTSTHGTGCAFSSALLCSMLSGHGLLDAAAAAKRYVESAMRSAPGIGRGRGPMDLLWTRKLRQDIKGFQASADIESTEAKPG